MNIQAYIELIVDLFPNVVSDILVENDSFFSCVWYRTIMMSGRMHHSQLALDTDNIGFWNSPAVYLSPKDYQTYEEYLLAHASLQIKSFNDFCLRLLPDKYMSFYSNGFKYEKSGIVDEKFTFDAILEKCFASDVIIVDVSESKMAFILYETLCFELQINKTAARLYQVGKNGTALRLLSLEQDDWKSDMLGFLSEYSYRIIPDKWFNEYRHGLHV